MLWTPGRHSKHLRVHSEVKLGRMPSKAPTNRPGPGATSSNSGSPSLHLAQGASDPHGQKEVGKALATCLTTSSTTPKLPSISQCSIQATGPGKKCKGQQKRGRARLQLRNHIGCLFV